MRHKLIFALLLAAAALAQPLRVEPARVLAESPGIGRARAAFGAGIYVAVWQDENGIAAARLRPGALQNGAPVRIAVRRTAERPAVAFSADVFLIVWQDFRDRANYDVRGMLLDARTGRPRGAEIAIAGGAGNQARPAVAAADGVFLVVWQEASAAGTHGIRGVRISPSGEVLDPKPHVYAEAGNFPEAVGAGRSFAVVWAGADARTNVSGSVGDRRGSTLAALVDASTGAIAKSLGVINGPCSEGTAVSSDDAGNVMTVAAREGFPNPWGWPGPGAVLCSRILAGGAAPEAALNYGTRMSNICARTVPNVIDGARWGKTSKSWDAGEPGGFPGTADGLWPHGWPAVAYGGSGRYLFAWVKGSITPDRLNLSGFTVWLRSLDGATLQECAAEQRVDPGDGVGETWPALAAGPPGEVLLLTLRLKPDQPRRLAARRIAIN